MAISIELPESGNNPIVGNYTKVFNSDGVEIQDITKIDVSIRPDSVVTAVLEVIINDRTEMKNIHALLGTKTLRDIATLHGFELKRIGICGSPLVKNAKRG